MTVTPPPAGWPHDPAQNGVAADAVTPNPYVQPVAHNPWAGNPTPPQMPAAQQQMPAGQPQTPSVQPQWQQGAPGPYPGQYAGQPSPQGAWNPAQQQAPYAYNGLPVAKPTTAARSGKVGFWVLVGALALSVVGAVLQFGVMHGVGDSAEAALQDAPAAGYAMLAVMVGAAILTWVGLVFATIMGILGLVRRERPQWWSIIATGSIVIHFILNIGLAIIAMVARAF